MNTTDFRARAWLRLGRERGAGGEVPTDFRARAWLRLPLALGCLLLGAAGCYEQNVRVVVFPDGSGRIVVARKFTAAAVRLSEMQAGMGGMAGGVRAEMFFSEKALRADAQRLFGKGVRFVSAQRVEQSGARGSVAVYAFDKVEGLSLRPSQLMQAAMRHANRSTAGEEGVDEGETDEPDDEADAADTEPEQEEGTAELGEPSGSDAYRFRFTAGARTSLTVRVPAALRPRTRTDHAEEPDGEQEEWMAVEMESAFPEAQRQMLMGNGNPLQLTGKESSQEIMVKMYKGARFSLEVEVRGAAATMNAGLPDPRQAGRCTLLRVDLDEFLRQAKSAARGARQAQAIMMNGDLRNLIGAPGVACEKQAQIAFVLEPAAGRK